MVETGLKTGFSVPQTSAVKYEKRKKIIRKEYEGCTTGLEFAIEQYKIYGLAKMIFYQCE